MKYSLRLSKPTSKVIGVGHLCIFGKTAYLYDRLGEDGKSLAILVEPKIVYLSDKRIALTGYEYIGTWSKYGVPDTQYQEWDLVLTEE